MRHIDGRAVPIVLVPLIAAVAAAPGGAQAAASGHKWGSVIVSDDGGSKLQACRTRQNGAYGAVWRVRLRGDNRRGTRPAVVRATVVRHYFDPATRNVAIDSWRRRAAVGRVTRPGTLHASILRRDALRMHQRRPDGSGTLTWVIDPKQLPRCGMPPRRRHWTAMSIGGSRLETCSALTAGAYGPVYRIWGRGNNVRGDLTRSLGVAVVRGAERQVIAEWNVSLAPGAMSQVRVVHTSLFQPDTLVGGIGDQHGGAGGDIAVREGAVC